MMAEVAEPPAAGRKKRPAAVKSYWYVSTPTQDTKPR
jgi:hypothetical protein